MSTLEDASAEIRDECYRTHIKEIMSTPPVLRSEVVLATRYEMSKLLRSQTSMSTVAIDAFVLLIEKMIEAKLDAQRDNL